MKERLEDIKTDTGARLLDTLRDNGWRVASEYSPAAFDKGIDFDAYTLKRGEHCLEFEWSNWLEWSIEGDAEALAQVRNLLSA